MLRRPSHRAPPTSIANPDKGSIGRCGDYQKPKKLTTAEFAEGIEAIAALLPIIAYWR